MSTDLMPAGSRDALRLYALETPSPLRDAAIGASAARGRRALPCLPVDDARDPWAALAAWHAVLHWLRHDDEPVVSCLHGGDGDGRLWPLVSRVDAETSLQALYADLRAQGEADHPWLAPTDPAWPGLDDQSRAHAIHPAGAPANGPLADFALVCEQGLWRLDCATERCGEDYQRLLLAMWVRLRLALRDAPQTTMDGLDGLPEDAVGADEGARLRPWVVHGPDAPVEGDLNRRFAAIVAADCARTAVVDEGATLDFGRLDALSSAWARALRAAGVARGDFVGVAFDRSHRMVAAQIAVLKLGAAFVPMDAGQPESRLAGMVEDTGLRVVLSERGHVEALVRALPQVRTIAVEDVPVDETAAAFVAEVMPVDAPAYVIFTSGSTGRPKGVLVSHGNLLNFVDQIGRWFEPGDVASQFAPFTFDASVAEIHSSLLNGGATVLLPAAAIDDPGALQAFMTTHGVTFAAFPPQYAKHLSPEALPGLRMLMTAGSAPDHELVRRWHGRVRYVNAYGPTETTILSTAWLADRVPDTHEAISIGAPIVNTAVEVCNRFGQVLPRGAVGELLIGGAGVTHGYLRRDELTRDRFVVADGLRWYRSGDLCAFDAGGALVFAGRVDSQIKLRGHRLEPGEVETALTAIDGVLQAATVVVEVGGSKQLVAFCTGQPQPEAQMRERLGELLPAWAMPNRLLWLASLPLTVNGKTDYRRLREQLAALDAGDEQAPEVAFDDPLEAEVAAIWRNVLQQPRIGIDDHFIHLGGDSLTALVVMSALKRLGYDATSSLLLARPRLGDFVDALRGTGMHHVRDYAPVTGEAPLGPIQGWFFRLGLARPGGFCQSLVFDADERLDPVRLHAALSRLSDHHDMLRAGFTLRDPARVDMPSAWTQAIAPPGLALPAVATVDLADDADAAAWDAAADHQRHALAADIALDHAPLFRVALLRNAQRSRVVWVLHHLVVDTISHGLLLEDLHQLYTHPETAVDEVLPGKSIAYGAWARALDEAIRADLPARLERWRPALAGLAQCPPLSLPGAQPSGLAIRECRLPAAETAALLERATACYRQSAEELVLAAACLAIGRALGLPALALDIEWHGRDEAFAGAQGIDRTVGWFTSVHPLAVALPGEEGLGAWLMALKEARVAVPERGRDFYALRYLVETPEALALFAGYRAPQVLFNFSGVVRRSQAGWRTAPTVAIEMGEGNASPYALSVESEIRDGELVISLFHDAGAWGHAADRLADGLTAALREVIAHCLAPAHRRWTPSDFPLAALDQARLDTLPTTLRTAYAPTDMQRTMIRHPETYQVFMAYRMPEHWEADALRRALDHWVQRHDCLRTHVRAWDDGDATMLVLDALEVGSFDPPPGLHRIGGDAVEAALAHIETLRRAPVRIDRAPLFSVDAFASDGAADGFALVLSIHHMIHDGWSIDLLINDLLACYRHALGRSRRLPSAPMAEVPDLLRVQHRLAGDAALQAHWAALPWGSPACALPTLRAPAGAARDVRLHLAPLDPTLVQDVRAAARRLGTTVNSLWLAGYAALLRYVGGVSQVRCGVIQNGRMEEVRGVETITGCCVNTLPLVLEIDGGTTGTELVAEVGRQLERMREAAAYPLSAIHAQMRPHLDGELFDTLFNIESHRYAVHDAGARPELVGGYEATNHGFLFSLIERVADDEQAAAPDYMLRMGYDATRYDLALVQDWAEIYAGCMRALAAHAGSPWRDLPLLPDSLRTRVVETWNATDHPYASDRGLTDLIAAQAARAPEAIALVCGDVALDYRALDARSTRLARHLRTLGVDRESVVGVCMTRSIEMVVALHGILKAGGAYVPLDPELPAQRIDYMIADVGAGIVLTQGELVDGPLAALETPAQRIVLDREWDTIAAQSDAPLAPVAGPADLAYVIFTSGSTGKPKAAMNAHGPVVNRIEWGQRAYPLDPGDRVLQKTPFAFDVSVVEFFWPFIAGATLVMAEPGGHRDPAYLGRVIREQGITSVHFVPSMLQIFVDAGELATCTGLRYLFVSGEAMPVALAARVLGETRATLHNLYGPTEAAIEVSHHTIREPAVTGVPIGAPIDNVRLYVLDEQQRPVPPGVAGELYIGGVAVCRGYFGRDDLTAEKFLPSPFVAGERLYRTGDLARWRSDGQVEYLGRTDHQVKIRGFRVELGEIESVLDAHEGVRQSLVMLRKDGVQPQLVAYVVARAVTAGDEAARQALIQELAVRLKAALPEYMVPAAFVVLDAMPVNANGKADRARLPEPDASAYLRAEHVAPEGEIETALHAVWASVLGHEGFGATDGFYAVGGDSIMAIQVVAAAARRGIAVTQRQVIEGATIRGIAAQLAPATASASGPAPATPAAPATSVAGVQRLLPIQIEYFAQGRVDVDRYAQYAMFPLPAGTTVAQLRQGLHALVARHDALRLRFRETAAGWVAQYRPEGLQADDAVYAEAITELVGDNRDAEALATEALATLDIRKGRLLHWHVLRSDAGDRLLWTMHHLVVDGVSWRVLDGDLRQVLEAVRQGARPAFGPASATMQAWATQVQDFALGAEAEAERDYWLAQLAGNPPRLLDADEIDAVVPESATRVLELALDARATSALFRHVGVGLKVQTLLVAALGRALGQHLGTETVRIDLEGHGRADDADLSATVGWCTVLYPQRLDALLATPVDTLQATQRALAALPRGGAGYGALRHLALDEAVEAACDALGGRPSDVLFNYLGHFSAGLEGGAVCGPSRPRSHPLRVNGAIFDGCLRLRFDYAEDQLDGDRVRAIAEAMHAAIDGFTACSLASDWDRAPAAAEVAATTSTPAAFALDAASLDALRARLPGLEDAFPCSPMQQGLLVFSSTGAQKDLYLTQMTLRLGPVDAARLRRAWERLVARHAALRTAFVDAGHATMLQVVLATVELPWQERDFAALAPEAAEAAFAAHAREALDAGFDPAAAPLMRLSLVRMGEDEARLVWTHHHALLDGWSASLLIGELCALYDADAPSSAPPPLAYRAFVEWMAGRDRAAAETYWRGRFAGLDAALAAQSPLRRRDEVAGAPQRFDQASHVVELSPEDSARLVALARREGVGLGTLVLAGWGLLLGKYIAEDEALFGYATSGRSAPLPGIESSIGLFINTLPMRVRAEAGTTLSALLCDVQRQQLDHEEHAAVAPSDLQRWSGVRPGQALFDTLVVVENYPRDRSRLSDTAGAGLRIRDVTGASLTTFGLNLVVYPGERIALELAYQRTRFDDRDTGTLLRRMALLLSAFAGGGEQPLSRLSILDADERRRAVEDWNATALALPADANLPDAFERVARECGDATALVHGGEAWSYARLAREARTVAHALRAKGLRDGDAVALSMGKGPALVAAMIGIMAAGAAYVPVAVDCPAERRAFIVADAGIVWTLTDRAHLDAVVPGAGPCLAYEDLVSADAEAPAPGTGAVGPGDRAYVIYTSGTTGLPKGVAISHRALLNFCAWCRQVHLFGHGSRITQFAPYTFDASAGEIFGALLAGSELHLLPEALIVEPAALQAYLLETGIAFSAFPPPYLQQLDPGRVPRDFTLLTAGSAPSAEMVRTWGRQCRYINGYGPTETTILSTAWICEPGETETRALSIGGPICNTAVYVVDRLGQLCPPGLLGEIWIGGDGVANGYLNRPELDAEVFLPDPWRPGGRIYRTGDLGRWREDGQIEFAGRRDRQVKLRGFRIELDEIEARLLAHPQVAEAAVAVRGEDQDRRLLAWVVAEEGVATATLRDDVRAFLRGALPDYMLPQAIAVVPSLPLTGNGKVDVKALPEPEVAAEAEAGEAPRDDLERTLAAIWAEMLQLPVERLSRDADFFALGGHSLLAMRTAAALRERIGADVGVADLLANPVLRDFAHIARQAARDALPAVVALPRDGAMPLSFVQQRLWFLAQMQDVSRTYHIPAALRLSGALDVAALRGVLDRIVARHEGLRATFTEHDGVAVQRFAPEDVGFALAEIDLSTLRARDPAGAEAALRTRMREVFEAPFDLAAGPLLRGALVRMAEQEHVLLIAMHHIVMDGWSLGLLVGELGTLYRAACAGEPDPLPALDIQYADFAAWQQSLAGSAAWRAELDWWTEALAGVPALLDLPTDRPRPPQQRFEGAVLPLAIDEALADALRALAQRAGTTLFTVLMAGWAVVLQRLSRQDDVVIGIPAAGRPRAELAPLVGFFVNTLPIRVRLSRQDSFAAVVEMVRDSLIGAQAHAAVPFEQIVDAVKPERSLAHTPLFQAMFSWQDEDWRRLDLGALELGMIEPEHAAAKFDITLSLSEDKGRITGGIEYATALFDRETIERHAGYLVRLLRAMVETPERCAAEAEMVGAGERARLLHDFNRAPVGAERCGEPMPLPLRRFEAQVAATPDAVALVCGESTLDYAGLDRRARAIARALHVHGVRTGDRVAVCLPRGIDLVASLIATWKLGAAYVPLDPAAPSDRLHYQVEDSAPAAMIVAAGSGAAVVAGDLALHPDDIPSEDGIDLAEPDLIEADLHGDLPAYVLYTSGSTGRPKAVVVEHAQLGAYLRWAMACYADNRAVDAVVSSPIVFDATITSLYLPLLTGGRALLLADGDELPALEEHVATAGRAELIKITPAHLHALGQRMRAAGREPAPMCFVVGGEALPAATVALWRELSPQVRIVNEYGPTETVVGCVVHEAASDPPGARDVPIGRPIAGMYMRVLDDCGGLAPIGVAGELCIGGAQVARGYLGREALTAERFVPDVFAEAAHARLYRSGDLVRWRRDGVLEYLGRNDFQVKIRGFRIEPGEIEARLAACPGVVECVVLAREDRPGDRRLVAYVAGTDAEALSATRLRAALAETLPEYMVPAAFVALPALPLTANGKVDRRALPAPDADAVARTAYVAPQGEAETVLAAVWAGLLDQPQVGRDDQFFALGGHSLMVIQMLARLRECGFTTDIRTVLLKPSLAELAAELRPVGEENAAAAPQVPENRITADTPRITPDMLPLADLTQADIDRIVATIPGGVAGIQDIYRLGPLQEGFLFHSMLDSEGDAYLLRSVLGFDSRARLDAFLGAMQTVIDRHDVMRTSIHADQLSEPVQVVHRKAQLPVTFLPEGDDALERLLAASDPRHARMDLGTAPLLSVHVVREAGTGEWVMALLCHHIVCDNATVGLLLDEVRTVLSGEEDRLPTPQQYRDFVARIGLTSEAEHEAYFRAELGDVDEPTLPFGLADAEHGTGRLVNAVLSMEAETIDLIRRAARAGGVSPAVLFHAAWALVLARCSGRSDVVFGTVLSGRQGVGDGAASVLGTLINTLPLRVRIGDAGTHAVVLSIRDRLADLLSHEQAPLTLAQRCSGVSGPLPLFNALINYVHGGNVDGESLLEGVRVRKMAWNSEGSSYPLALHVTDHGDDVVIEVQSHESVPPEAVAGYVLTAVTNIASALLREADAQMAALEILPEADRRWLLRDCNRTGTPLPAQQTIHALFEAQAARTPDAVAVIQGQRTLSYARLDAMANRVARRLSAAGMRAGELVGLYLERTPDMLAAILGVLKAGGAYVPMDPDFPAERIGFMIEDAAAPVVIANRAIAAGLPAGHFSVMALEDMVADGEDDAPASATTVGAEDVAYVLFTSGSTGRPKGVCVPHRAAVNFLASMAREPGMDGSDTLCAVTTLSFDIALLELMLPLSVGACVVLSDRATARDADALMQLMEDASVTVMQATPATWRMLLEGGWQGRDGLRILCGGEALPVELANRLSECGSALWNLYGPTETTVWSTVCRVMPGAEKIDIGHPIDNTEVYVVDERMQLVPPGAPGELLIGGLGVSRGYLGRPELTAEKFITDHHGPRPGGWLYRTGDLVRRGRDGRLEMLGRMDQQVKIRGFRIELGEIERCLEQHPCVSAAVVIGRAGEGGRDMRLVGYVRLDAPVDVESLRTHARAFLPEYMVPSALMVMDAFPLTANNKVDRKRLPDPSAIEHPQRERAMPASALECEIAEAWSELLGIQSVGRDDSFFDLGGDSILSIRLLSMLRKRGMRINAADIYRLRTVAAIADAVERAGAATASVEERLSAEAWPHAFVSMADGRRVLVVDVADEAGRERLRTLLGETDRIDDVIVSSDPRAMAEHVRNAGPEACRRDGAVALEGIEASLAAQCAFPREPVVVESMPFSEGQRNMLPWQERDTLHCIELDGWHSPEALQRAFTTVASEQDVLRAIADVDRQVWGLLDPDTIAAHPLPVVRLKHDVPVDGAIELGFKALDAARRKTPLAYAAAWISPSDMRHCLLLSIDHLIWDAMSLPALKRRLQAALSANHVAMEVRYADFIASSAAAGDAVIAAEDAFLARFPRAPVVAAAAATSAALAARAAVPLRVLQLSAPLRPDGVPAEQAFDCFRNLVHAILDLPEVAMTLQHHGRRRGDRDWFDHVGLFLDKVPVVVGADSTLAGAIHKANELQKHGLGYLEMEARAVAAGEPPTLPPLHEEVLFNFQTEGSASDPRSDALALARLRGKLREFRGLMFEARVQDGDLRVLCVFRGNDDTGSLMTRMTDDGLRVLADDSLRDGPIEPPAGSVLPMPADDDLRDEDCSLVVRDVHKRYGDFEAVRGVSFRVRKGRCFGILGPNGAGKTSLLAMIEGLVPISAGSISILGMDVASRMQKIQPHLGVQLQQNNYFKFLTVAQLLKFYQELRSAVGGGREGGPSAEWLLERLNLKDKLGFKVDELSGGQKQRLSIAIALLEDPDVIFLDEPTSALDPQSRLYTWEFIEQLKADGRKTIIMTTHYMEEAERLCDEIMIMNHGRVIAQGEPSALVRALQIEHAIMLQLGRSGLGRADAARLAALPGVAGHEWDARAGVLTLRSREVPATLSAALALATECGFEILHIDVERPTLEDVFLTHTGKELRE